MEQDREGKGSPRAAASLCMHRAIVYDTQAHVKAQRGTAMPVTAVVGANWGDEGKGKITDFLAREADFVVRYQGGNNAGHTIINEYGKFALHLLPSGVFSRGVVNVIGPGVALNVPSLLAELESLAKAGVPTPALKVSDRVQVVLPYHILFDELEEARLAHEQFGSTKKGIAPFYADKYLKIGLQLNEVFDGARMRARLSKSLAQKNVLVEKLYGRPPISVEAVIADVESWREKIAPYVEDTTTLLLEAVAAKKSILLEGQLGTLRDPDHGIYPYPTSSSPLAGFGSVGAGVPPWSITKVVAVTKAYSSCVGAGPFVTEIFADEGEQLRKRGGSAGEYGATTGRPRRVGWFDCVATSYGCRVQGATEVAITNLDVLGYRDSIPVCTAYSIGGVSTDRFPVTRLLDGAAPVYQELPGWKMDISATRSFGELPENARRYVKFIEERISAPIAWISVGPNREQTIRKESRS
jgi:adenylosuccinate synthase